MAKEITAKEQATIDTTKPLGPQIASIIETALKENGLGYSKRVIGRKRIGFGIAVERQGRRHDCQIAIESSSVTYR